MTYKKTTLALALTSALSVALNMGVAQAAIIDFEFDGLFTFLDSGGIPFINTGLPFYDDSTWGYGLRTQISGTLQFNTANASGSGSINPFQLFGPGTFIDGFEFKSVENNLMIGRMDVGWNGTSYTTEIVLDASGLLAEVPTMAVGNTYDATSCAISEACATPASNDIKRGSLPIGPAPIATSSYNVVRGTGTLDQLSLGSDDGIGGSPLTSGPYSTYNQNYDFTSLTVTNISAVPVPAAVWLFGSGLLGLAGLARRRRT